MRVVGEIARPDCKITIFSWNQKFIVKFEQGDCEQTFKLSHLDVADEAELRARIDGEFIHRAVARFEEMHQDLGRILG